MALGPKEDTPLDHLVINAAKIYRIEEVPRDELHIAEDEMLISCAHFQKEVFSTFGLPFLLKIKQGEPFTKVKGMWVTPRSPGLNYLFSCVCFRTYPEEVRCS